MLILVLSFVILGILVQRFYFPMGVLSLLTAFPSGLLTSFLMAHRKALLYEIR